MNREEHHDPQDASVEAVLHALRETSPAPGLEDRVLQGLAVRSQSMHRAGWQRWPLTFAVSAALAACAVTFALHRHHATAGTASKVASLAISGPPNWGRPQAAPGKSVHRPSELTDSQDHSATPLLFRPEQARVLRLSSREARVVLGESRTVGKAKPATSSTSPLTAEPQQQASFPAPEMPLTEEERLLIQIAHRNDPVQVALLDPHERNLTIARERAESKHFFAPRPLPPDLQQQIDATIREQYALTQPPIQEKPLP